MATLGGPVTAQEADTGFERHLFPPDLVMRHQQAIDLTDAQRDQVSQAIQELQANVQQLQWDMSAAAEQLTALVGETAVDKSAVLSQVDRVLHIERQVKRAHIAMLVEVKNALTADQQSQLRELRTNPAE
ncbi:MAG: periplasmic heavy metal sensor [Gemmatimonadetes bacterium]|nr:periplasmic heavy metal sensor [Gemmatimonadota bacterium]